MSERQIIFSTPMVKAILDGRKTQTRRVVKPQAEKYNSVLLKPYIIYPCDNIYEFGDFCEPIKCPYGQPGDVLWVRETWTEIENRILYKSDLYNESCGELTIKWKPSIHMPRKYARIFLEVTNIRVERVQDITNDDAKAEGIIRPDELYIAQFPALWNSINDKRGFGWSVNPWVWVVEFKRIEK